MADFNFSFSRTDAAEGGYTIDEGGETWRGIARRYHPTWAGWQIIDREKSQRNIATHAELTQILRGIPELDTAVRDFYRAQFWNPILGDEIPGDNIAATLYDCAVNHGPGDGIRWLQDGLNALNNNQKNYPDILVDGGIGDTTIRTLRRYLELFPQGARDLIGLMMGLRIAYYNDLLKGKPEREREIRGWVRRAVKIIKDFC